MDSWGFAVVLADFNGDSKVDFAFALSDSPRVDVGLGNGDGSFAPLIKTRLATGTAIDLVSGDWDGDGKVDLGASTSSRALFLYGHGDGHFDLVPVADTNYDFQQGAVAAGDLDGDGRGDYAKVAHDSMVAYMGSAPRLPGRVASYAPPGPTTVSYTSSVIADFDGDGHADFAMPRASGNALAVYYGLGNGTFEFPVLLNLPALPQLSTTIPVPSASRRDLAVALADSGVAVLRWFGSTFLPAATYKLAGGGEGVAAGDFNADGVPDLAVTVIGTNNVAILLGRTDGTFGAPEYFNVGSSIGDVESADLNGDGLPDLAVVGFNALYILLNTSH